MTREEQDEQEQGAEVRERPRRVNRAEREERGERAQGNAFEGLHAVVEAVAGATLNPILRWEGRIGHPRQLLSGVRGMLEDLGFTATSALEDSQGPMRDVSYFHGIVIAKKEMEWVDLRLLLLALITVPILVGIWLFPQATRRRRALVTVEVEGETYWAGAKGEEQRGGGTANRTTYTERSGVIGETRIALRRIVGPPTPGEPLSVRSAGQDDPFGLEESVDAISREVAHRWPALAEPGAGGGGQGTVQRRL